MPAITPERYSFFKATSMLKQKGHEVFPVGIRAGKIDKEEILLGKPQLPDIDTVTLYVGPKNQPEWFDYVFYPCIQNALFLIPAPKIPNL